MMSHRLQGPGNDVALFRRVLEGDPFRLRPADITTLTGLPSDLALRPTRANIEREFRRLREVSRPGDEVTIFFSGHGSQQPADPTDPTNYKADGLDEIVLPADASGWDADQATVRNALVDKDVRRWVTDIRNTGAFVWIIFDACHSGTMSRGFGETVRGIPMRDLVPQAAIDAAASRAARWQGQAAPKETPLSLTDNAGRIAALYAATMNEETPERPLPNANSSVYGLFTYTIANILQESTTPMTYRELAERVLVRYHALQRFTPNPIFEGGGLDQEILGERTWPERPLMLLGDQVSASQWRLDAGSLRGLTQDSILELFPPAGKPDADTSVGHVRIARVEATSAVVEPVAFDQLPAPAADRLVPASRARVKAYSYGDLRLKVALQQQAPRLGTAGADYVVVSRGAGPAELEKALASLPTASNGLAERVDTESADWFVRVVDNRVVLVPASGWQPTSAPVNHSAPIDTPPQFVIGRLANTPPVVATAFKPQCGDPPVASDGSRNASLADSLGDALRHIARASNLTRMATASGSGLPLDLRVTRYDARLSVDHTPMKDSATGRYDFDAATAHPLFERANDFAVKACRQLLQFHVRNQGTEPLDVTLLYLDAAFGITPLLPEKEKDIDNRVQPGEDRALGPFLISDDVVGWESAVAIGVPATSVRQNFAMLAQPSLPEARGSTRGLESPLQTLLSDAAFGRGMVTRGSPVLPPSKFVVKFATWHTEPPGK
jgi:hypothetical protein